MRGLPGTWWGSPPGCPLVTVATETEWRWLTMSLRRVDWWVCVSTVSLKSKTDGAATTCPVRAWPRPGGSQLGLMYPGTVAARSPLLYPGQEEGSGLSLCGWGLSLPPVLPLKAMLCGGRIVCPRPLH